LLIGLRSHVFWGPDVVKHVGLVGYLFHLAVSKINDGHCFTLVGGPLEQNVIRFEVSVHYFLVLYERVSLKYLLEYMDCLLFRKAIGVLLDII